MQVKVLGRCSRVSKKLIRQAVQYYAELIMSSRLRQNLVIQVEFKHLWILEHCIGGAYPALECDPRPRDFILEVNSEMSKRRILMTIAHEMVHIKQYATGQLKYYVKANKIRWEDMLFDNEHEVKSDKNYWFSPWELLANGYEPGMYVLFGQHIKNLTKQK